jgi:cell shape-determining protein MreD
MDNKPPYWKPAVKIFMDVSTWVVVPIIFALVFGKMLDAHYGTKPIIFLVLTGVAFIISCVGIVRVVKNYMKNIPK